MKKSVIYAICIVLVCQGCSNSREIVDYFSPGYYSNEKFDIVDTLYAPVDSIYVVKASFLKSYEKFTPINWDNIADTLFRESDGQSLSYALSVGEDSTYVLKGEGVKQLYGRFLVKNLYSDKYFDFIVLSTNEINDSLFVQNKFYPIFLRYTIEYQKQLELFTTVVSSCCNSDKELYPSPGRKLVIIPDIGEDTSH